MNPFAALHGFGRFVAFLVCLLILSAFGLGKVFGATTLDASVTSANGELATVLTWQSDKPQCIASGHESFAGPVASSGTLALPPITMSGTYTVRLDCSTPASLDARLSWENPTTNTDGSAYTNPAGTRIVYGRTPSALSQSVDVPHPAQAFTIEGLALGDWFFGARAFNTSGVESAVSNLVAKAIRNGETEADTVTLTVNPIPGAPTNLAVEGGQVVALQ